MTHLPVMFQDFESEAHEYAHMTADNAVQQQSILDFKKINEKFPEFGPDFDIDNLGIKDFGMDWHSDIEAINSIDENLDGITATIKVTCPQEIKDEVLIYLKAKFLEVSFEGVNIA